MIRILNLICEYAALIRLRYREPNTPRPFVVPGGIVGAWLLGVPTVVLATFTLVKAEWLVWACGGAAYAFMIIAFFARLFYMKFIKKEKPPQIN